MLSSANTLVGLVRTNASSQFQDIPAFRGVLSWFNQRKRPILGPAFSGVDGGHGNMIPLAGSQAISCIWGDGSSAAAPSFAAGWQNMQIEISILVGSGDVVLIGVGLDATTPGSGIGGGTGFNSLYVNTVGIQYSASCYGVGQTTEGSHTLSAMAGTNASSTASYYGSIGSEVGG